jgi:hypothetical protein
MRKKELERQVSNLNDKTFKLDIEVKSMAIKNGYSTYSHLYNGGLGGMYDWMPSKPKEWKWEEALDEVRNLIKKHQRAFGNVPDRMPIPKSLYYYLNDALLWEDGLPVNNALIDSGLPNIVVHDVACYIG